MDDEINDNNLPFSQVSHLYLKVSGSIYSALSQDHLIKDNENKQRTVCYYSLGAYLLHFYDTSKFIIKDIRDFQEDGTLILEKFINQGPLPELILLSQNLIKENFATNDYKWALFVLFLFLKKVQIFILFLILSELWIF